MKLRQLEILRAIIRYNTTVAAAQLLGMSQPAVSNAIKKMEEQVGFALFHRVNNRIYPTPETRILLNEAEAIFEVQKRVESKIKDLRDNRAGQLRIVATPPLGYGVISTALRDIQIQRPRVRTFFDVHQYDETLDNVERHQSELGFVLGFEKRPGLASEILFHGEMTCVMQPDHPLSKKKIISPFDLVQHRLIALQHDTTLGMALHRVYAEAGVDMKFAVEVRYGLTACVLANSGVGVAVVDPLTARSAGRFDLVERPFCPCIPVHASAIWAENRNLTRLAKSFLHEIRILLNQQSTKK